MFSVRNHTKAANAKLSETNQFMIAGKWSKPKNYVVFVFKLMKISKTALSSLATSMDVESDTRGSYTTPKVRAQHLDPHLTVLKQKLQKQHRHKTTLHQTALKKLRQAVQLCQTLLARIKLQFFNLALHGQSAQKVKNIELGFSLIQVLKSVTRQMAAIMGLQGRPTTLQMNVAGGGETLPTKEKEVTFRLESLDGKYTTPLIEATTTSTISKGLRAIPIKISDFAHLRNLTFTETFPRGEVDVDIMVGLPYYNWLIKDQPIMGQPSEPMALPTKLGMVLTGSCLTKNQD